MPMKAIAFPVLQVCSGDGYGKPRYEQVTFRSVFLISSLFSKLSAGMCVMTHNLVFFRNLPQLTDFCEPHKCLMEEKHPVDIAHRSLGFLYLQICHPGQFISVKKHHCKRLHKLNISLWSMDWPLNLCQWNPLLQDLSITLWSYFSYIGEVSVPRSWRDLRYLTLELCKTRVLQDNLHPVSPQGDTRVMQVMLTVTSCWGLMVGSQQEGTPVFCRGGWCMGCLFSVVISVPTTHTARQKLA